MSGIPSDQVLAIIRLRQWLNDRAALRAGRIVVHRHTGWRERRLCEADARNVRILDFERAFEKLDPAHQMALVMTYGQGQRHENTAAALDCSVRTIAYMLPAARSRLAEALDRLDLL